MWISSYMINIFFRILNLGLLFGAGWFVYKKYLKAILEDQLSDKEAFLKGLSEQEHMLKGQASQIDRDTAHQNELGKKLSNKVDQWHVDFDLVLAQRCEEKEKVKQTLDKRLHVQTEQLAKNKINSAIIPKAVHNAEKKLKKEFSETKKGKEFISSIVDYLERESRG